MLEGPVGPSSFLEDLDPVSSFPEGVAISGRGILRANCPFSEETKRNLFIYPDPPHFHCLRLRIAGNGNKDGGGYVLRTGA